MSEQTQQKDPGPELNLNLYVAEINFVLASLAKAPFDQVEGLINKIRAQGQAGYAAYQQAQVLAAQTETSTGEEA